MSICLGQNLIFVLHVDVHDICLVSFLKCFEFELYLHVSMYNFLNIRGICYYRIIICVSHVCCTHERGLVCCRMLLSSVLLYGVYRCMDHLC